MDEITTNDILLSIQHTKASVCDRLRLLQLNSERYESIKEGAMRVHREILTMDETKTSKDKLDQLTELELLMRIQNVILDFVNWKPKDIKTVFTKHMETVPFLKKEVE